MEFKRICFEADLENGVVPLCLTPEVLLILNHGFEHLTDTRNANGKVFKDLGYLQHAVASTQFLRLSHGGNTTIQSPVDLSTFHKLSQLDIKRIPPHWIVGLNKFQGQLILIRMSRSINFLEDLLGKKSNPDQACLAWNKLKKLYLSNNFVRELDSSLDLLPCLEVLDLSQNYLSETGLYLQSLIRLVHINLAYNSLSAIPTFSSSTCKLLKTLVLRANRLEHINGVEHLESLEILDLTSNVLCDHGALSPLGALSALNKLYLEDNPLSYNSKHRVLTGAILCSKVLKGMSLDGQQLSDNEIKLASSLRASIQPSPEGNSDPRTLLNDSQENREAPRGRRLKRNIVNVIQEIPQPNDDADVTVSSDGSLDIVDAASSQDSYGLQDGPLKIENRMETLREEFGDSWLQTLSVGHVPQTSRVAYKQSQNDKTTSQSELPVEIATSSQPITEPGESCATDSVEPQSQYGSVIEEDDSDIHTKYDSVEQLEIEDDGVEQSETKYGSVEPLDTKYGSVASSSHYSSTKGQDTDTDESTYSVEHDDADEGEHVHESFIVKLPKIDADEFFITIMKKQIVEKNIEGRIIEMLDLSALLDVQTLQRDGSHTVKCKFDYIRKDRRERCYLMEDLHNSLKLVDILQPIVAENQAQRKTTETMECFKCGKQFVIEKNRKKSKRVDCVCIHCGSEMVVEVSSAVNSQSTPYSSQNSSPSNSFPKPKAVLENTKPPVEKSLSNGSLYLSAVEDEEPLTPFADTDRTRSGTDATDSTIGADSQHYLAAEMNSGDEDEDDVDADIVERIAANAAVNATDTPDTMSYQSLDMESVSDVSGLIDDQRELHQHEMDPLTGFKFDPTNLSYIDHRLKLHLTVAYFDDGEDLECVVRCKCVEYTKPKEYSAIVIFTNTHFYILRVYPALDKRLDVGIQLELVNRSLISDIRYIEIGLAHQNIRVEFEKLGYCVLLRDGSLGRLLHTSLSMMMSSSAFNKESKLKSIAKVNQEYYRRISACLPEVSKSEEDSSVTANYMAAFKQLNITDGCNLDSLEGCLPISLVVDDSSLYILKEAYHFPFTRNRLSKNQMYFTLDLTIPIGDIASLSVSRERCEVDIKGFEEESRAPRVVFVSPASMFCFIDCLKSPWKAMYDVDLEVNYSGGAA